ASSKAPTRDSIAVGGGSPGPDRSPAASSSSAPARGPAPSSGAVTDEGCAESGKGRAASGMVLLHARGRDACKPPRCRSAAVRTPGRWLAAGREGAMAGPPQPERPDGPHGNQHTEGFGGCGGRGHDEAHAERAEQVPTHRAR